MENCASSLTSILPLSGAVLAVSLAYANLKKFRYGDAVEKSAKNSLKELDDNEEVPKDAMDMIKGTASYKALDALANFQTKDIPSGVFKEAGIRFTKWVYRKLFLSGTDTIVSTGCAVFAGICIIFGSAHPAGIMTWSCQIFANPNYFYWPLLFGFVFSPACVLIGTRILRKCRSLRDHLAADLSGMMRAQIQKATISGD